MIRRKYAFIFLIITGVTCFVMVCFFLFSINRVSNVYIGETQETILRLKKDFLKDSVNNLMAKIDIERKTKAECMETLVSNTSAILDLRMSTTNKQFNDFFINFFKDDQNYHFWTVLLWDNKTNKAIYDTYDLASESLNATLDTVKSTLSSYRMITRGDVTAIYGISKSYIDELVKKAMADTIRSSKFNDNSYIWVNEILNYQGGYNYAIRRVHPNLPQTEGMYLSTDMTDIKGNLPYLAELQGINKDGELFFSYYFKEPNSENVSKKLTYAKLYKDYNWVVAMGVYLNDLQSYVDQTNSESQALSSRLTVILVCLFIIILFLSYALIMLIEKFYYRHSKRILESQVNQDSLTKADSRRSGTNDLISDFKQFKKDGSNPGIMLLDVDNFKNINDTYGHVVGDLVLIEIVKEVQRVIRSSDKLIRWGGDEFIVIFYGLQKKNARAFGETILSVISSLKISAGNEEIHPTLSIGCSYFQETDSDYTDVLKRSDQALYQSKTNGRNQANLIL